MSEAAAIATRRRDAFPQAQIGIEVFNDYPGLATPADAEVVRFVGGLVTSRDLSKIDFGTEGASSRSASACQSSYADRDQWIKDSHKPDEFIALDQLEACDRMMDRLLQCCL